MTALTDRKTTWQDRLAEQWTTIKPLALVLALGLVAGPLISNYMGWQVTRGFSDRQSHSSAVEQQAMVCSALAQVETPDAAKLGWAERRTLAEKFAVMPGRNAAESDVVSACSQLLAAS